MVSNKLFYVTEFANFFTLVSNGATVTITLDESISEQSLLENRLIVLELQASGPQAITAYATIVFQIITEGNNIPNSDTYLKNGCFHLFQIN